MVWGDSQVVINWENTNAVLNVLDMVHWCERDVALKSSFLSLNFSQIYREHNSSADALSKEALFLHMGILSYFEILDGEMIRSDNIQFFYR